MENVPYNGVKYYAYTAPNGSVLIRHESTGTLFMVISAENADRMCIPCTHDYWRA